MAPGLPRGQWFATTHWSVILEAKDNLSAEAEQALERLCRTYWYPLYSYLRRKGQSAPDAQDLTQGFFTALIEKRYLDAVDRKRGKFRSFLLTALNHFVADAEKHARRLKRGGGQIPFPLEMIGAEERFRGESPDRLSADRLFERRWALTVLERVLERLGEDYEAADKAQLFEHLHPLLLGERPAASYHDLGTALRMSEGAVKVAVHRMRHRFQDLLREEIAHTVTKPEEVEEEIDELIAALRG